MVDVIAAFDHMLALADFIRTMINNYFELKDQLEETLTTVVALSEIVKRRSGNPSFNQKEFEDFLGQAMNDLKRLDSNLKSPSFRTSAKEKLLAGQRLDELANLNARLETRRKRLNTDVAVSMEAILQSIASVSSVDNPNAKSWWEKRQFGHEISPPLLKDALYFTFEEEEKRPGTTFMKDRQNHQAIIDLIVDFLTKMSSGEKVNFFKFQEFSKYGDLTDIYMNVSRWKKEGKVLGRGLIIATPGCTLMDTGSYKAAIKYFSDELQEFTDDHLRFFLKYACDKLIETMRTEIPSEESYKKSVENQIQLLQRTAYWWWCRLNRKTCIRFVIIRSRSWWHQ